MQNAATMSQLSTEKARQAALDKLAQERESRAAANAQWQQQWAQQQAERQQQNADRSFGLQQQQFGLQQQNAAQPPEEVRKAQWIAAHPQEAAAGGLGVGNVNRDVAAREAELKRLNLNPADPRNQQYMLTGKFPREDAQPLTPTDKKAILEADEMVQGNQSAIDALKKAKEVSPTAWGNYVGSKAAGILSPFSEDAQHTVDLDNIVTGQALSQLKTVFGGNPTEGERAIMLQLQGSSRLPDKERQKIYDRAIEMANKRLEFNRKRGEELRGGTFYAPKNGAPAAQPQAELPVDEFPAWSIKGAK
jgi:hypothetical protein